LDIKTEAGVIGKTFHEIVVDSIDIAIMVTDNSGNLLYLNPAAESMWNQCGACRGMNPWAAPFFLPWLVMNGKG